MIQFKCNQRSSAEGGCESSALTAYQSANQQGQQRLHSAFALFTLHTSNECDLWLSGSLSLSNTLSISAFPAQTNLFILMSSNPDLQQKQTFLFRVGAPVICFHLQTGAAVKEILNARQYMHVNTQQGDPFIPRGPPSGSFLMRWPFVVETIFTSETQNGFINSIRG